MSVAFATRAERVSRSQAESRKQSELSHRVWESRYRYAPTTDAVPERSLGETWDRVATALAGIEPARRVAWRRAFRGALDGFKFLPAGRILAGAGAATTATLANCFVMGRLDDSIDGTFERLKESAVTMRWGGGIGCDFSPLSARGAHAAGPLAHMRIWDAACEALSATGARRGAMMATLRCDHPDIEAFIAAKRDGTALHNFNLSVLVTDEFMAALEGGKQWPLRLGSDASQPLEEHEPGLGESSNAIARLVSARGLWQKIVDAAYDCAEPGVLFIDRINRVNNLYYCEHIAATNPCGEVPLPPHGACVLGSVNLTAFVHEAFSRRASFDLAGLERIVPTAVRLLDDAVDVSTYPLPQQDEQAKATRRIGLGITGLGDALIMLGMRYDSEEGRGMAQRILTRVRDSAYRASTQLAAEKGVFGRFERDAYLAGEYVRSLPSEIRDRIARCGMRNSHLLAVAPAGTISLLANNVSSGVEPVFALEGQRRIVDERGVAGTHPVRDYAFALWREQNAGPVPPAFVTAAELTPDAHVEMVAALQPLVDGSIAKTINVPESLPRAELMHLFERAYALGVKGCTVFRPNAVTGAVLTPATERCCLPVTRGH
jgi:ribonucleoside-diphosphate reductase alpha chain